jgi:hypothetical protein
MMAPPEFDWTGEDRDSIIVHHQPAIAVYRNADGHVVIRQEGHYGPEEDHFVLVRPENAARLVDAIMAIVRQLGSSAELAIPPRDHRPPLFMEAAE